MHWLGGRRSRNPPRHTVLPAIVVNWSCEGGWDKGFLSLLAFPFLYDIILVRFRIDMIQC